MADQQDIGTVIAAVKKLQASGAPPAEQWAAVKAAGYSPEAYIEAKTSMKRDADQAAQNAPLSGGEEATGALASLNNGLLFGAGPKVSGAIDYLLDKLPGMRQGDDPSLAGHIRAEEERSGRYAGKHPIANAALEGTGALASSALPVGRAMEGLLKAGQPIKNALRGAGVTGLLGGVSGDLSSSIDSSPGQVVGNTVKGTAMGAATGLAAAPLVAGMNAGLDKLPGVNQASDAVMPALAKLRSYAAEKLGMQAPPEAPMPPPGPGPGMPPGAPPGPPQGPMPSSPVLPPPAPPPPATGPLGGVRGVGTMLDKLEADGDDPMKLRARLQGAAGLGKPQSIAAVSLPQGNVQQRGRAAISIAGPGKADATRMLNDSVTGMPDRVAGDVNELAGMPAMDTEATQAALRASKKAAMGPAYKEAFSQGEVDDPDLRALLTDHPGYEDAFNLMRTNQLASSRYGTAAPPLFGAKGELLRNPTVRDLDMIKKGLDAKVRDAGGGLKMTAADQTKKESIGEFEDARKSLMDVVNPLTPKYTAVRQEFGDTTEIENAFQDGRDLLRKGAAASPFEVRRQMAELSEAGKRAFKMGVQDAIRRDIYARADSSPGTTPAAAVGTGEGTMMQMIRTVFGDGPAADRFLAQMKAEQARSQTRNAALSGSRTDANVAGIMDTAKEAAEGVAEAATHPVKAATKGIGKMWESIGGHIRTENNKALANEIYRQRTGGQDDEFMRALDEMSAKRKARRSGNAAGLTHLLGPGGYQDEGQ